MDMNKPTIKQEYFEGCEPAKPIKENTRPLRGLNPKYRIIKDPWGVYDGPKFTYSVEVKDDVSSRPSDQFPTDIEDNSSGVSESSFGQPYYTTVEESLSLKESIYKEKPKIKRPNHPLTNIFK